MTSAIRVLGALLAAWACILAQAPQSALERHEPVAVKDLVRRGDPLAAQDLRFDASFAQKAIEYVSTGDAGVLRQIAASPAASHLLNHARNFDYDVPQDSTEALVSSLLAPGNRNVDRVPACERSLNFFYGPMLRDPQWLRDSLQYLPDDFRFHGSLFLTFGYDIGVAIGPTASLNCTHKRFEEHPAELIYYAIHELHHVGFMSYQPPPRLRDLKTCADVLRLVRYSTQLEGMAVWAVYRRRNDEHALAEDPDYVALTDETRMKRAEESYLEDVRYLQRRSAEPADAAAWAVINRMSGGERLWYRVGAHMAQSIERELGRPALVELVRKGPDSFLETYWNIKARTAPPETN
jgi:hypothetical protein